MSQKSTALNAISLPLNQVNLIEASAGTGKTYTIGSIYLRLLLQAGENCFSRPLNVEEILVVTFTEMATEDLKRKIRERLTAAISVFSEYYETKDKAIFTGEHQFLAELLPYLEDIPTALRRLKLAEQNLDLASIYTNHLEMPINKESEYNLFSLHLSILDLLPISQSQIRIMAK